MAYSFLLFDFGADEDAAQQARHRIEGWRQAFRLDKKLQFKFDRAMKSRSDAGAKSIADTKSAKGRTKSDKAKSKSADEGGEEKSTQNSDVRFLVRLDFSDHEKLSYVRWLERIPSEAPFKSAKPRVVRPEDADFRATSDLFDELHPSEKKNYS